MSGRNRKIASLVDGDDHSNRERQSELNDMPIAFRKEAVAMLGQMKKQTVCYSFNSKSDQSLQPQARLALRKNGEDSDRTVFSFGRA
jgi:hypothetical protein